ncbi:MAG: M4 family metallopeptidase [Deltaproteobacteria bacterium]|nr:M4 family metallopeptidase [Deltaproteobacteria bacterium]
MKNRHLGVGSLRNGEEESSCFYYIVILPKTFRFSIVLALLFLNSLPGNSHAKLTGNSAPTADLFSTLKQSVIRYNPALSAELGYREPIDGNAYAASPQGPKIERDSESIRYESGNLRSVELKPGTDVKREVFFAKYANDYGIRQKGPEGFQDSMIESGKIELPSPSKAPVSSTSYRYQQSFQGGNGGLVPVIGGEMVLRESGEDDNRSVVSVQGRFIPGIELDTKPALTETQAYQKALNSQGASKNTEEGLHPPLIATAPHNFSELSANLSQANLSNIAIPEIEDDSQEPIKGELIVTFKHQNLQAQNARLAWKFRIPIELGSYQQVEIDAQSGEVIAVFSLDYDLVGTGDVNFNLIGEMGETSDAACLKDAVEVFPSYKNAKTACSKLLDDEVYLPICKTTSCPVEISVLQQENDDTKISIKKLSYSLNDRPTLTGPLFDLAYASQTATSWFSKRFNWKGVDGSGENKLIFILAHSFAVGQNSSSPSAHFSPCPLGACFVFRVGSRGGNPNLANYKTYIDTVIHELTHAVIHYTSHLGNQGESGALGEAFADIFAALITQETLGKNSEYPPWKLSYLRNLANPKQFACPDTYHGKFSVNPTKPCKTCGGVDEYLCDPLLAEDGCGMHCNSQVVSHAWYIMVNGKMGINDLGSEYDVSPLAQDSSQSMKKAEELAFRVMTTLPSTATYSDARDATISLAKELFGKKSPEVQTVTDAFYAVGIGSRFEDRIYKPAEGYPFVNPKSAILKWSRKPSENGWEIQVSSDPQFSKESTTSQNCLPDETEKDEDGVPFCTDRFDLKPFTQYYWRVRILSPGESPTEKSQEQPSESKTGNFSGWAGLFQSKAGPIKKETLSFPPNATLALVKWGRVNTFTTVSDLPKTLSPATGDKVSPFAVEFSWEKVEGATGYEVQIGGDKEFSNYASHEVESGETTQLKISMAPNEKPYYWRLKPLGGVPGKKNAGWISQETLFYVDPNLSQAKLLYPIEKDALPLFQSPVKFQWSGVKGASSYQVFWYENIGMKPGTATGTPDTVQIPELSVANAAQSPKGYCWSVTSFGPENQAGKPSDVHCYGMKPPSPPKLLKPVSPVTLGAALTFEWTPVTGVTSYRFVIQDVGGKTLVDQQIQGTSTSENEVSWNAQGYYWRVAAIGPENWQGEFSAPSFYQPKIDTPVFWSPDTNGVPAGFLFSDNKYFAKVSWNEVPSPYGFLLFSEKGLVNSVIVPGPVPADISARSQLIPPGTQEAWVPVDPESEYQIQIHVLGPKNVITGAYSKAHLVAPGPEKAKKDSDNSTSDPKTPNCTPLTSEPNLMVPEVHSAASAVAYNNGFTYQWQAVAGATGYRVETNLLNVNYLNDQGNPNFMTHISTTTTPNNSYGPVMHPASGYYLVVIKAQNNCSEKLSQSVYIIP